MLGNETGIYHFWPPFESDEKSYVYDPVKLLNVYGYSICGVAANLLACLFLKAGFEKARVCTGNGHYVCEVFYDER